MVTLMVIELDLIEQFRGLSLVCEVIADSVKLGMLKLTSGLLDEIRESQKSYVALVDYFSSANEDKDFRVNKNGILKVRGRVCVPGVSKLKKTILEESHWSCLSIHPGATKMYKDLKKMFGLLGMKRDAAQLIYS
ncbi:uncharacterized protein LOC127080655 [Lathyrus oleraceus]|uniref:uncharacterized protein LOC127080655 n=1 Tax=Pisum sativum TaxID=3888 RepID=UPI0021D3CBDA|nr:uncharacterized protein LOC127080655 [Pisum sativum]